MAKIKIGFLYLIGILIISITVINLPLFQVKKVYVESLNNNLKINKKLTALNDNFIFALLFNQSYYKKWFLNQYPVIENVKFQIKLPNTCVVSYKIKRATYLMIVENQSIVVSEEGFIFDKFEIQPNLENINELMIVRGLPKSNFKKTKVPEKIMKKLNSLKYNILKHFPEDNLQLDLSEPYNIALIKEELVPIKLGSYSNLDIKLKKLRDFLHHPAISLTAVKNIDLRNPGKVIIQN